MAVRLYGYIPLQLAALKHYHGLSKANALAAMNAGVAPFIDASCAEEPSLSSPNPAVTSICRPGKGIAKWNPGDIIIYWTNGWLWQHGHMESKAIPAVLCVHHIEPDHKRAASFYSLKRLTQPSNIGHPILTPVGMNMCAVAGVAQQTFKMREYSKRVSKYPHVAICDQCYVDVCNPVWITKAEIIQIFGKVPRNQNGVLLNGHEERHFRNHMSNAGVSLPC